MKVEHLIRALKEYRPDSLVIHKGPLEVIEDGIYRLVSLNASMQHIPSEREKEKLCDCSKGPTYFIVGDVCIGCWNDKGKKE